MYSRLIGRQTRLARTLALAALLLLTAAQLLEAGHSHAAQDAAEHCLLCKNSTDAATIVASQVATPPFSLAIQAVEKPQAAPQSFPTHHLARGPPLYA